MFLTTCARNVSKIVYGKQYTHLPWKVFWCFSKHLHLKLKIPIALNSQFLFRNTFFVYVGNKNADRSEIWDALHNLVLFLQFKKCEKHPWRSVTISKMLFAFFKLYKWYQITQNITYDDSVHDFSKFIIKWFQEQLLDDWNKPTKTP